MGNLAAGNVRLTNYMRERIANKVMDYKFTKKTAVVQEIQHELASIATAAYNRAFNEKERALMDTLPHGWIPQQESIKVKLGWTVTDLHFNGFINSLPYGLTKRMRPNEGLSQVRRKVPGSNPSGYSNNVVLAVEATDDLAARYQGVETKIKKFREEFAEAQTLLDSTLKKATTSNKLIEMWPEIKPFVNQVCGTPAKVSTALTVPIADLNVKFGLPVPEAA